MSGLCRWLSRHLPARATLKIGVGLCETVCPEVLHAFLPALAACVQLGRCGIVCLELTGESFATQLPELLELVLMFACFKTSNVAPVSQPISGSIVICDCCFNAFTMQSLQ